jgi:hypothetical protein
MKFYSETLKQLFDSEKELLEAESANEKKRSEFDALKNMIIVKFNDGINSMKEALSYADKIEEVASDEQLEDVIGSLSSMILKNLPDIFRYF